MRDDRLSGVRGVGARAGPHDRAFDRALDVRAFAVLKVAGRAALYEIAPFSGRAVAVGAFGRDVVDLAIPLAQ